ncbi:hypothetical protein [Xanthomarina gelatinilytica]|uniref:hypothetical protein n=1 Tax=Xanthomarina gelatinilytica TaxID=1137281 RepID=UPI003AA8DA0F
MTLETKLNFFLNRFMAFTLLFLISACSVEDGVDGTDGEDGQDGNANVITSDWFQIQYDDMSGANPPTWGAMKLTNEDIPEVDLENFVETGGVALVYVKLYEGTDEADFIILSTPTTLGNLTLLSGFSNLQSELGLTIEINGPDVTPYENIPSLTFRYVLIPASVIEARQALNKEQWCDINTKDYSEVRSFLGIVP